MPHLWENNDLIEIPAYSPADAARYLGVSYTTLHYWIAGRGYMRPLIRLANDDPPELSFANLLECHILKALTGHYKLAMRALRSGVETLTKLLDSKHPLLDKRFKTDGVSLILNADGKIGRDGELVNVSKGGQIEMPDVVEMFLERIVWNADGLVKYYPFVSRERSDEPKIISMTPAITSGRSVIDGTGVSTAVVAARFAARETPKALAREYRLAEEQIHEAIRWETGYRKAA
jgi:uncharacterized protein (DUF433 family)